MEKPLKEYVLPNGEILRIYPDDDPQNPRENDNLGHMFCGHKNYNLGDEQFKYRQFDNRSDLEEYLKIERKAIAILPLYLLDHSGLWMRTCRFECDAQGWDTGFVGFIYCTEENLKKMGTKRKDVQELLEAEVKKYSQYLEGNVYGFVLVKAEKCAACGHVNEEIIDSRGNFYGSDLKTNGMLEQLSDKVKEFIIAEKTKVNL